jgi:hypothetical protein
MRTLYLFLDISGDYAFTPSGSKYLVFTSLCCEDTAPGVLEAQALKHDLIATGQDLYRFHACDDNKRVRRRVFQLIANLSHARVDSLVIEKTKVNPSLYRLSKLYPTMIRYLLQYPFDPRGLDVSKFDCILVFLDRETANSNEKRAAIAAIKRWLKQLPTSAPFYLCMHSSCSHPYLQFADYASWAIFRRWERGDHEAFQTIQHLVSSEYPIFAGGTKHWY